jgi:hypothetical protein
LIQFDPKGAGQSALKCSLFGLSRRAVAFFGESGRLGKQRVGFPHRPSFAFFIPDYA